MREPGDFHLTLLVALSLVTLVLLTHSSSHPLDLFVLFFFFFYPFHLLSSFKMKWLPLCFTTCALLGWFFIVQVSTDAGPVHQSVYGKGEHISGISPLGAVETVYSNAFTTNEWECTRCTLTRLIGCIRGRCFYRCYRRCNDGNGTVINEAIKFVLPGY